MLEQATSLSLPKDASLSRLLGFLLRKQNKKSRSPNAKDADATPATATPATCPLESERTGTGVAELVDDEEDVGEVSDAIGKFEVGRDNAVDGEKAAVDVADIKEVVSIEAVESSVVVDSGPEMVVLPSVGEPESLVMEDSISVAASVPEKGISDALPPSPDAMLLWWSCGEGVGLLVTIAVRT